MKTIGNLLMAIQLTVAPGMEPWAYDDSNFMLVAP